MIQSPAMKVEAQEQLAKALISLPVYALLPVAIGGLLVIGSVLVNGSLNPRDVEGLKYLLGMGVFFWAVRQLLRLAYYTLTR